jgi:outer membrane protein assembly factor BamB
LIVSSSDKSQGIKESAMKRVAGAAAWVLLAYVPVGAQTTSRIYTRPEVPSPQVLDRLNLKLVWRNYVPAGGVRDGIYSAHVLDDQILVQMRSGMIAALNPETGAIEWSTTVGQPYRVTLPLGYNRQTVFAFSGVRLYALDRSSGALKWEFAPPRSAGAAPMADDDQIYLSLGPDQLYVYRFVSKAAQPEYKGKEEVAAKPDKGTPAAAELKPPLAAPEPATRDQETEPGAPLDYIWDAQVAGRLEQPPLIAGELLVIADTRGTFFVSTKHNRGEVYQFQAESPVSAPMGQYEDIAYVASRDFSVFALDISNGRILWRFTADRNVVRKPVVTDEDLFVASEGAGLFRVNRLTGSGMWRNTEAERFLAVNKKYVYALDRHGRLLILDKSRGNILTALDVRDYVVPIRNESTDRVYLASHDGLIVCLRDRDQPTPLRVRKIEEKPTAPAVEEIKPAAPAKEEKPPADKGQGKPPEKG